MKHISLYDVDDLDNDGGADPDHHWVTVEHNPDEASHVVFTVDELALRDHAMVDAAARLLTDRPATDKFVAVCTDIANAAVLDFTTEERS